MCVCAYACSRTFTRTRKVVKSLGDAKNATVQYYQGRIVPGTKDTLLLFGSFVEAVLNFSNACVEYVFNALISMARKVCV